MEAPKRDLECVEALAPFSAMLRLARQDFLGVARSEIAAQVGVSSMTLRQWEQGDELPSKEYSHRLAAALGLNARYVERERIAAQARLNTVKAEHPDFLKGDPALLAHHQEQLLVNLPRIRRVPRWRDLIPEGVGCSFAYLRHGPFTLGTLLAGWCNGELTTFDNDGRPIYLLRICGSPLSGRLSMSGFRAGSSEWTTVSFSGMGMISTATRTAGKLRLESDATLAEVITELGLE